MSLLALGNRATLRGYTSRGYSPANLSRSHPVAQARRVRPQTGPSPRASGGDSPHTNLTLSGVSLATPRRTQATQVTWRLRFMMFGLNPARTRHLVAGRGYELHVEEQRAGAGACLTSLAGAKGKGRGTCKRWARPHANNDPGQWLLGDKGRTWNSKVLGTPELKSRTTTPFSALFHGLRDDKWRHLWEVYLNL